VQEVPANKERAMLLFTRKLGESINIGGNIQLKVLKVRGSQVQLGIAAQPEIQVLRQEIVGKGFPHVRS
jgi:carbon storage regulator